MDEKITTICKLCGEPLGSNHSGSCPKCGGFGKKDLIEVGTTVVVNTGPIELNSENEHVEENKKIKWLTLIITLLSPFLGLLLTGLSGVLVGLVISVISYKLGIKASKIILEREIIREK
ncbi:hypothetical protein MSMTP_0782 [Methanosarcina sp. MTP4]|uniref:hypothetical protein n=1 Tax=Methanosarcina sp. MTP4 TaxID=1434100 RepID=UPI0006154788|nr:hypothetical protein [Methanosarcina sp. MTP4]AKB24251.1 hypothetical protein MSMTP_0782 [Methanosarcina sp. MTP4]